jgi:hypothetical protein
MRPGEGGDDAAGQNKRERPALERRRDGLGRGEAVELGKALVGADKGGSGAEQRKASDQHR